MAVNYALAVKTVRMNAVVTAIDQDAGVGSLEICTAAYAATLITYALSDPCATVTDDVLTIAGLPKSANAAAGGTAAVARIKDNSGDIIVSGLTVGTSASDIIISNTTITNGAAYSLTAGTITHAA